MKYESILATFVVYTLLLALLVIGLWTLPDRREPEMVPGWIVGTSAGKNFQYPPQPSTSYVSFPDWPPQIQAIRGSLECEEAGLPGERAGRTEKRDIGGREYCVTEVVQGAAGSIYTQYAYAFEEDDEILILTFTTQKPQCLNYPEPQMSECAAEQNEFKIDEIAAQIAETIE